MRQSAPAAVDRQTNAATGASWAVGAVLLAMAAFLLWPVFTAVHVEGFSAQIQSLALILAEQGSIAGHDLARPLVSQFIFLTRPGVVDLLALSDRLFGYTGSAGFHLLTALSLAGLLLASARFASRQAGVPWWCAMLACVLTPGLVELGFYFNDNVVSAAFAALALTVAAAWGGLPSATAAGLLFGMAVLCRIDAVLAGPLLFLLVLLRPQRAALTLGRLAVMGVAALALHALAARINGGDLFDALRITKIFAAQHLEGHGRLPGKATLSYFFGALVPVLLVIGGQAQWKNRPAGWRRWAWIACFYVYPVLVLLYVLKTTLEIRYFLPLLGPIVAWHAGTGVKTLRDWLRSGPGRPRRAALGLVLLGLLLLAAPPAVPLMRDGPRVFIGRLWSPMLWMRWQDSVNASMQTTQGVVASLASQPRSTLVTTHWNDEFYLRLGLFEAGYREVPAGAACPTLSRYVAGDRVVWHVRVQPEYWLPPFPAKLAAALPLAAADSCGLPSQGDPIWATTFGKVREESTDNGFRSEDFPAPFYRLLGVTLGEEPAAGEAPVLVYPLMSAVQISPSRLQVLTTGARSFVAQEQASSGTSAEKMVDQYVTNFGAR